MNYWLMKSEPDEVSFDDLLAAPESTLAWFGVRNYQARNFMRDQLAVGDGVLFYHSSCALPGVAGVAVDVKAVEQGRYLPLAEMRAMAALEEMVLLQRGSRLSVSPVTAGQWRAVLKALRAV